MWVTDSLLWVLTVTRVTLVQCDLKWLAGVSLGECDMVWSDDHSCMGRVWYRFRECQSEVSWLGMILCHHHPPKSTDCLYDSMIGYCGIARHICYILKMTNVSEVLLYRPCIAHQLVRAQAWKSGGLGFKSRGEWTLPRTKKVIVHVGANKRSSWTHSGASRYSDVSIFRRLDIPTSRYSENKHNNCCNIQCIKNVHNTYRGRVPTGAYGKVVNPDDGSGNIKNGVHIKNRKGARGGGGMRVTTIQCPLFLWDEHWAAHGVQRTICLCA